jgi:hypothetical protein
MYLTNLLSLGCRLYNLDLDMIAILGPVDLPSKRGTLGQNQEEEA